MGEAKDTEMIYKVFEDPFDQRVSHDLKFYGISVYQSKMVAMRKISGLNPPKKITYAADSSIVTFYKNWAKEQGYVK